MNRHILTLFLFFYSAIFLPPVFSDQQNPLLTPNAIILSQQGVYRFDRNTLDLRWQSLAGVQTYQPVMGNQLLYVGSTQGLYALNPVNGKVVWHIEPAKTVFSPAVSDRIYAGSLHGELYAIDPEDGSIEWRRQLQGWTYSPVVLPHRQQLWTAGQSHRATRFDSLNGQRLGQVALGQEAVFSPEQIDDSHIAVNLFSGSCAIINLNSGSLSGRLSGSSQPKHLLVSGDTLYRTDRSGNLAAFNRLNLMLRWHRQLGAGNLSMHPAIPGYLLMSDLDSQILLFDLTNNKVVYQASVPGQMLAPVQVNPEAIVYFTRDSLQPNHLQAVKLAAGSS